MTWTMLFRLVAWALLLAIVVMTVVPAPLRVVTAAPHNMEHALIFLATGIAIGLGYELPIRILCVSTIAFCAVVELVQLAVPGRHARLSDFIIDAAAASFGIAIAWIVRRLGDVYRLRERRS